MQIRLSKSIFKNTENERFLIKKKKNIKSLEISHSTLGKEGEKKWPTFAMWSTQTRLYTLPCRSVGPSVRPSVPFLNSEWFLHYCSCLTVRYWIAMYLALFFWTTLLASRPIEIQSNALGLSSSPPSRIVFFFFLLSFFFLSSFFFLFPSFFFLLFSFFFLLSPSWFGCDLRWNLIS